MYIYISIYIYIYIYIYILTNSEFTLKKSCKTIHRIQDILLSLFVNRYKYVPFDVESLFTNVPIKKIIDVIHKYIIHSS